MKLYNKGPPETEFAGGIYHVSITLPIEYPMKPPYIIFLIPSGQFKVKEKICLSFTNYHPEYWQPAWTIQIIFVALVSFSQSMRTNSQLVRCVPRNKNWFS
jgi:ubiquitin-conjugating enzyme E2 J1